MTLGQFGSRSDTALNESTYTSVTFGGNFSPNDRFTLGVNASCTVAEESMHEIDLSGPPDVMAILKYSTYDLSEVHTYSDLDSTMWDVTAHADLKLASALWGTASYTRLDYQDDAPYVENQTGSLDIFQVALRWTF